MKRSRRKAIGVVAAGVAGAALGGLLPRISSKERAAGSLRPPGAGNDERFLDLCIRCGRCGPVCPTACISFVDSLGPHGGTPVINPKQRACVLCMRCTQVCPTDALPNADSDLATVARSIRMGLAHLDANRCWSHRKLEICRACWYACPFPDSAIRLDEQLRPRVDADACVGCGLCAQACPRPADAITMTSA